MALKFTQSPSYYLSGSGVIIGATTVNVTSFSDIYGNVLTMADFGAKGYGTLEPDSSNEESFTWTGVTANANGTYSLTGVSSALAKSPYTETSGLVRSHSGGTKMVISDTTAFWNTFANKNNDETIGGNWTFVNAPVALSATRASTSALGNVKLTSAAFTTLGTTTITIASPAVISFTAHGLIAGDSVQFTTTGALPTGLASATDYYVIATGLTVNTFQVSATVGGSAINTSGTQSGVHTLYRTTPFAVGNDDIRLPQNFYKADTGAANAYVITLSPVPTAYVTGQQFAFKATNANTTASTLNVNGLGAKTIKKNGASDLASGDISAGQIIEVVYDGTNFQVVSPLPKPPVTVTNFTASGTYTKPVGLQYVIVRLVGGGGGGSGTSGSASPTPGWGTGGGGGGYSEKLILAATLGATETVTIGAAGTAGTAAGPGNGGTGGTTSFGAHLSATGGVGGPYQASGPLPTGGVGSSGTINTNGSSGVSGFGVSSVPTTAGAGGSSLLGGGGTGGSQAAAATTGGYGGGGGGAYSGGPSGVAGAAGGAGFVTVTEYYL